MPGAPGMQGQAGGQPAAGEVQTPRAAAAAASASAIPFEDDILTPYERFFSSNPINSTILAMDELSMGLLTLNQVGLTRDQKAQAAAAMAVKKAQDEQSFMEERKQALEQRQYEVHIVGEKRPNRMLQQ